MEPGKQQDVNPKIWVRDAQQRKKGDCGVSVSRSVTASLYTRNKMAGTFFSFLLTVNILFVSIKFLAVTGFCEIFLQFLWNDGIRNDSD